MGLTRSQQMSRIRGRHTEPERTLRKLLWRAGLRYRLDHRTPFGRPDIVFPKAKVAVFIDGCFWHGCPEHYARPRTSETFWATKLRDNVSRDRGQTLKLEKAGWRVCRIWEHDLETKADSAVERVLSAVRGADWTACSDWRVIVVEPHSKSELERWHLEDLRDASLTRFLTRTRAPRR